MTTLNQGAIKNEQSIQRHIGHKTHNKDRQKHNT